MGDEWSVVIILILILILISIESCESFQCLPVGSDGAGITITIMIAIQPPMRFSKEPKFNGVWGVPSHNASRLATHHSLRAIGSRYLPNPAE